jgi:hypothetical protein
MLNPLVKMQPRRHAGDNVLFQPLFNIRQFDAICFIFVTAFSNGSNATVTSHFLITGDWPERAIVTIRYFQKPAFIID